MPELQRVFSVQRLRLGGTTLASSLFDLIILEKKRQHNKTNKQTNKKYKTKQKHTVT